jgi:hypothetical protein
MWYVRWAACYELFRAGGDCSRGSGKRHAQFSLQMALPMHKNTAPICEPCQSVQPSRHASFPAPHTRVHRESRDETISEDGNLPQHPIRILYCLRLHNKPMDGSLIPSFAENSSSRSTTLDVEPSWPRRQSGNVSVSVSR